MLLAIDPGCTESAYVIMDDYKPIEFAKVSNEDLLAKMSKLSFYRIDEAVIEMVASYGMPVGKEVFETCVWIGRFYQEAGVPTKLIYRQDVKLHLCHNSRAKDSNIRQALIDRFGVVGTKKDKGWFYGFKDDIWQAYALAVTYADKEAL